MDEGLPKSQLQSLFSVLWPAFDEYAEAAGTPRDELLRFYLFERCPVLLLFKRESSLRTNDVLAHRFPSFVRLARANRAIDPAMQFESFVEVVCAFDRVATPFVKNRRYHLDESRERRIA
jgi:hypothetical protein